MEYRSLLSDVSIPEPKKPEAKEWEEDVILWQMSPRPLARTWSQRSRYGICPRTLRRSTSADGRRSGPDASETPRKRKRRNSTSVYQEDWGRSLQSQSDMSLRHSSVLGLIALESPGTQEDLCLDSIRAWEQTHVALLDSWSCPVCIFNREFTDRVQGFWNPLADLNFAVAMYYWLSEAQGYRSEEEARKRYLSWRTEDQRENPGQVDEKDDRGGDGKQHLRPLDIARECYEMVHLVRPLLAALKRYGQQRVAHRKAQRHGRHAHALALAEMAQHRRAECERRMVALIPRFAEARERVCRALGLDPTKVFGSVSVQNDKWEGVRMSGALVDDRDEDEGKDEDEDEDDKGGSGSGNQIQARRERAKTRRRRFRVRVFTLKTKLRAMRCLEFLCPSLLGPRAVGILERMATKPVSLLAEMEKQQIGNAEWRAELKALRAKILKLLEETEGMFVEVIGLLDSTPTRRNFM